MNLIIIPKESAVTFKILLPVFMAVVACSQVSQAGCMPGPDVGAFTMYYRVDKAHALADFNRVIQGLGVSLKVTKANSKAEPGLSVMSDSEIYLSAEMQTEKGIVKNETEALELKNKISDELKSQNRTNIILSPIRLPVRC